MDNENNPINPVSPSAAQPAAPNGSNGNFQAKPVAPAPGAPVDNLVQDITPTSKPVETAPASSAQSAPAAPAQPVTEKPAAPAQPVMEQPASPAQPATEQPVVSAKPVTEQSSPAAPVQPMQAAAPAQPVTNTNNAQPASVSAPVAQPYGAPKKSHAGLIIGIVVLIVLVLGGVGGFLFYQQHEKTERVVADGIIKLLSAKELTANSTFTIQNTDEIKDDNDVESVNITLISSKNAKLESSLDATLELKLHGYDPLKVQAEAMEGENAIYFRIKDTGNLSSFIANVASEDGYTENIDVKSIIESMFASVGDSWYEIPYDKIDETGRAKETMDCVREKTSKITEGENLSQITSLYEEYAFISVDKDAKIEKVNGYKKYPLTIDEDKMDEFMDELSEKDFIKEIESCSESDDVRVYDDLDDDYLNPSLDVTNDLDDDYYDTSIDGMTFYDEHIIEEPVKEDETTKKVYLGIKPWSHDLVWIGFDYEKKSDRPYGENIKANGEINLSYTANVATPGDTKSIDELMEAIQKSVADSSKKIYYDNYCTADENYSGFENEAECKKAVDEAFGNDADSVELDDLLYEFGGLI